VIIIGRFEEDKIAEYWVEYDRYNLFRQLGAL
jgi:predicted ester cyclase